MMQTQTVFGLSLPVSPTQPLAPGVAAALADRMAAAADMLRGRVPAAVSASVRQDAQRYLSARRRGELRLPSIAATRRCDEGARALLRLTVDAPPLPGERELLVA